MGEALRVEVDPKRVEVTPGGKAVPIEVRIYNATRIVDEFVVEVIGAGQWLAVEPVRLRLFPDSEGSTEISVEIPSGQFVPAGERTIGVRVISATDPKVSALERIPVKVSAVAAPEELTLEPRIVRGGESAVLHATARNRANTPLRLSLHGEDPESAVSFTFTPPVLDVPAGGWARSTVTVAAPRPNSGSERPRQLTVRAEGGRGALAASGTFLQAPRFTTGGVALLGAVASLIGALILVASAFLAWITAPERLLGTEVTYRQYLSVAFGIGNLDPNPTVLPDELFRFLSSAGFVAILLGVAALLGLLSPKRRLTKLAGGLSAVTILVFLLTMSRGTPTPSFGSGAFLATGGALLTLLGGFLGTRQRA